MISIIFIFIAFVLITTKMKNKPEINSDSIKYDVKISRLLLAISIIIGLITALVFVFAEKLTGLIDKIGISDITLKQGLVIFSIFFWFLYVDSVSYLTSLTELGYELITDRHKYQNKMINVPHTFKSYEPEKKARYCTFFSFANILGAIVYAYFIYSYYQKWQPLSPDTAANFVILLTPFIFIWIVLAVICWKQQNNYNYKDSLDKKNLSNPLTGKERKNRLSLSAQMLITIICIAISYYAIYLAHIVSTDMLNK